MELAATIIGVVAFLWCIVRTWRSSALLAIISFFIWPVLLVPLLKNWGEQDDIKVPFLVFIIGMGTALWLEYRKAPPADPAALLQVMTLFA